MIPTHLANMTTRQLTIIFFFRGNWPLTTLELYEYDLQKKRKNKQEVYESGALNNKSTFKFILLKLVRIIWKLENMINNKHG